jgi:hypothetical protein
MKIRLSIECFLLLFLLPSCAEHTITPPLSEIAYKTIAEDATKQMEQLYPPAYTHLVLANSEKTGFDRQFKTLLRNKGYAIHETKESPENQKLQGKQFSYLLDGLSDVSHYGYYRLTLKIDNAQLSRLYDANELDHPNYWSYRQ